MCGIAGYAALDPARPLDTAAVGPMLSCIRHRGPDDEGVFTGAGIVLGHRRLSVIDVEHGHQPLYGRSPNTVIVINGEVYNYRELAAELRATGSVFKTASDSEVVAHAYDAWGLDFLDRLDGMFALALWDGQNRRLVLARDRMGEKPLFYAVRDGSLIFGSELNAIRSHPAVNAEIDPVALSQYLALEYVPAPRTILKDVRKLEAGEALVVENGGMRTFRYWQLRPRVEEGRSYPQAVAQLRTSLEHAVESRLMSDVPIGVFLSGGIDSSTVAALAARNRRIDTFCIGFDDPSFDESAHARRVAQHIGSRHHERILRPEEMPELVPKLAGILDEPLGDASIIPTALLSRFARESITVALGGDGGDELFAGYPMHQAQRIARYARAIPAPLHAAARVAARQLPVRHTNFSTGFKLLTFLRGSTAKPPLNHALWMSSFESARQMRLLHPDVIAQLPEVDPFAPIVQVWQESAGAPLLARATHLDALTYLPNDILTKVDRASMHVALEVRAPFLARDVVELAFSVPDSFRMRGLTGKRMLRDAVRDLLPSHILERPKKGFGIPVARWLSGPLRGLMEDLLGGDSVGDGLFDARFVRNMIREHHAGRADHRKPLWTLLVFEIWRREARALPAMRRTA